MGSSYGLIEVSGVVAAVDSLDAMCKASDVSLTWERKLGGRLVTIIVEGAVSDVNAAVEAATDICTKNRHILASSGVIASPCEEIRRMVERSAGRLKKDSAKAEPKEVKAPETAAEPKEVKVPGRQQQSLRKRKRRRQQTSRNRSRKKRKAERENRKMTKKNKGEALWHRKH